MASNSRSQPPRGGGVAFLSKDWKTRLGKDDLKTSTTSIIFTKDASQISGLSNSLSLGTNSATSTTAYVDDNNFSDVKAYWGSDKSKIVIYSAGTIMAPKSCNGFFADLENLVSLNMNNFNTSNVTDMSFMFYRCRRLVSLDVNNFDTSNVTTMSYMFADCTRLVSLDVNNFDTSNVTTMSYMFADCTRLVSLDVNNFDTSKVNKMVGMFNSCFELASLDVSNFDTSKVYEMGNMFIGCISLTSLNLGNFNLQFCTILSSMLSNCNKLTSLTLPYNLRSGYTIDLPASTFYNGSAGPYSTVGTATSGTTVACSTASSKVTLTKK